MEVFLKVDKPVNKQSCKYSSEPAPKKLKSSATAVITKLQKIIHTITSTYTLPEQIDVDKSSSKSIPSSSQYNTPIKYVNL